MGEANRRRKNYGDIFSQASADPVEDAGEQNARENGDAVFMRFVHDISRGKAIQRVDINRAIPLSDEYRRIAYDMPCFYFAELLSAVGENAIDGATITNLFEQAKQIVLEGNFHLPFGECAFLLRYPETRTQYLTYNIILLTEKEGMVHGTTFFQQPNLSGERRMWTQEPIQFSISAKGIDFTHCHSLTGRDLREMEEDARTKYTEVMVGTMLLKAKEAAARSHSPVMKAFNAERSEKNGMPPVQATRVVHFDRARYDCDAAGQTSAKKIPHDRRGHWRHLSRSGKDVWVSHSKINGGSTGKPFYKIVQ